jgi:uncharacterized membrane protein
VTNMDVDVIVEDYLRRLDVALEPLEPQRRHELVEEVAEHIVEGRAELDDQSQSSVMTLLDNLGTPEEIAAAAGAGLVPGEPTSPVARKGSREPITIALLLFGGFLFLVGWFVGIFMLWTSDVWRVREKLLGTLLIPGGLLFPVWYAFGPGKSVFGASCVQNIPAGRTPLPGCASSTPPSWGGIALLVVALMVPVIVAVHLYRTCRVDETANPELHDPLR